MSEHLLREVSDWKLEAKFEDSERYFYFGREARLALDGKKCYVIGRKGTGKTAISQYICGIKHPEVFSEKLTFKNFPFNELYNQRNNDYTPPNQYITIWKYLIYSVICRLLLKNESIKEEIRGLLSRIYSPDPIVALSRTFAHWTSREFSISVLGTGGAVKLGKQFTDQTGTISERVNILEDLILKYIDESSYYVVFDELDEDYKDVLEQGSSRNYLELLTSLFKAVQDIKSVFRESKAKIFPIIFLRDDIYDFISDPDKNKWGDFRIDLDWTIERIQAMLAFRISRAFDSDGSILPFNQAWFKLFKSEKIYMGDNRRTAIDIFPYITRSTHHRPRDYIKYLQACSELEGLLNHNKIGAPAVRKVDKAFSNYMRSEIVDEVQSLIPDINEVLNILSEIRKQTLSPDLFRQVYNKRVEQGIIKSKDVEVVLRILFHFSVIGNEPRQRQVTVSNI